jgi:hypothetical protein
VRQNAMFDAEMLVGVAHAAVLAGTHGRGRQSHSAASFPDPQVILHMNGNGVRLTV